MAAAENGREVRMETQPAIFGKLYRGEIIYDVKVSGFLVFKFALPPFSPPPPSVVQFSKQNLH